MFNLALPFLFKALSSKTSTPLQGSNDMMGGEEGFDETGMPINPIHGTGSLGGFLGDPANWQGGRFSPQMNVARKALFSIF